MGRISLGKVKGDDGKSVFIKFNTSATDTGASDTFQSGMNYIGFAVATGNVAPTTGYRWAKFVGEKGDPGVQGKDGSPGKDGANGKDGISITNIKFVGQNSDGNVYHVVLSNNQEFPITAPKGTPGTNGTTPDTSQFVTKGNFTFNESTSTLTIII